MNPPVSFARAVLFFVWSLAFCGPAAAQQWSFVGARYQGMGGAGVAVVDDEHASYWNPAALAFTESYGVAIPVGAYANASGDTLSDVDQVASYLDGLAGGSLDGVRNALVAGTPLDATQLGIAARLVAEELPTLDQSGQGLLAGADASLLIRGGHVAVTGIGTSHFAADPVFDRANLAVSDLNGPQAVDALVPAGQSSVHYAPGATPAVVADIESLFQSAGSAAPATQAQELVFRAEQAGVRVDDPNVAQNLLAAVQATVDPHTTTFADNQSGTFVRGLAVEQVGFGYGHAFLNGHVGLGGNLKYMMGTTFNKFLRYDAVDGIGDFTDALTSSDRRRVTHTASLDVGVLVKPWQWLRFGVTARDLTRPEFDLARDPLRPGARHSIKLDPQVRAGAALWILPNWVVALDADLTKNESQLVDGFESRIVSLGSELKLPLGKFGLAFRGGAYMNTAADALEGVTLTAGLGLRIFDFNLDLAAGASPNTTRTRATGGTKIPSQANASVTIAFRRSF